MFKVLKTFSGLISATKGQEIEIDNEDIVKDLLGAGYIAPASGKPNTPKETKKKAEVKDNEETASE